MVGEARRRSEGAVGQDVGGYEGRHDPHAEKAWQKADRQNSAFQRRADRVQAAQVRRHNDHDYDQRRQRQEEGNHFQVRGHDDNATLAQRTHSTKATSECLFSYHRGFGCSIFICLFILRSSKQTSNLLKFD